MSADRRITANGLSVTPPAGWEASIYQRRPEPGAITYPVVHAATVPLIAGRGDYGGGLVEMLTADDVFVGLLEFGPDAARSALFTQIEGVPGLGPDSYRPNALQRVIRGQAGVQRFFTVAGRAFCLYSVIGSYAARGRLAARANQLIGSLEIQPA